MALSSNDPDWVRLLREVFPRDCEISSVRLTSVEKGVHFMSICTPLEVRLKEKNGEVKRLRVLVKKPYLHGDDGRVGLSLASFNNEIVVYKRILPVLQVESLVGKMFAGKNSTCVEQAMESYVVLEDLTVQGFQAAQRGIFTDLPHLILAIRAIGQYHAQSYLKKTSHSLPAMDGLFMDVHLTDYEKYNLIGQVAIHRATQHRCDENHVKRLRKALSDPLKFDEIFHSLKRAEEPFAVVCHGDFNMNNIFFKYDGDRPTEVKFYDFQYACYGDPTVDLAFILYLNTSQELRNDHWDLLLDTYWNELATVPDLTFTKRQFFDNFARKVIGPIAAISHFLPVLLSRQTIDFNEVLNRPKNELADFYRTIGGDEGSRSTQQIMDDALQRGYLMRSIEFIEQI